VGPSQDRP